MDIDEVLPLLDGLVVKVSPRGFSMRASDARAVLKASGRTLSELIDESADLADKLQTFAFIDLRKRIRAAQPNPVRGVYDYPDPAELWAVAEDIDVDLLDESEAPRPDPLSATSSST